MFTAGGDYSATPKKKAVCGCTDVSHQDVRDAIRKEHFLTHDEVYRNLGWRTPNGCATCRPAINYYLISTWPKEAKDDPQSRFINERSHANIQKDGTYSVIPRMWGGHTTPDELRRIADAADKYKIPTVKVTGGQRIDLLGVKKEDLAGVWKDIGMPSGFAYAKSLRTVKTCVGSEWCRFGTQDSTQMGKDLERALWAMYSPHKVKLAVSGCPRNCAEAGIKDVGVIGVDSGWEIYVGGNGGIKTEVAQFLVQGEDQRGSDGVRRRLPAAVPRGRLVPGAHGALHRPRRPGPREEEDPRRPRRAARRCGSGCSSRSTASPIRGSSRRRRRSTCASSREPPNIVQRA
jgi:nitrite reductase (NADH) large subunit